MQINMQFGQKSDIGRKRSENQDSFGHFPINHPDLVRTKGHLFIVADGMGGHTGGKEASQMAVKLIQETYFSDRTNKIPNALKSAFEYANQKIFEQSQINDLSKNMGTTATALVVTESFVTIAHVGDSRVYHIRSNKIEQITQDHTHVAEMHRQGILSDSEMRHHPDKSVLIRALGVESSVDVEIHPRIPIHGDETFLLCTDGLSSVQPDEIRSIVLEHSPQEACERLIRMANDRGGHDNCTVQIVVLKKVHADPSVHVPKTGKERILPKRWQLILFLFLILCFLFIFLGRLFQIPAFKNDRDEIIPEQTDDELASAPEGTLLQRATVMEKAGDLDSSAILYRHILTSQPMHLGAIEGINRIGDMYRKQGDQDFERKQYQSALTSYEKALSLLPSDKQIQNRLQICRLWMVNEKNISPNDSELIQPAGDMHAASRRDSLFLYPVEMWDFSRLQSADTEIGSDSIIFKSTSAEKVLMLRDVFRDSDVDVTITNASSSNKGCFGFIYKIIEEDTTGADTTLLICWDKAESVKLVRTDFKESTLLLNIPLNDNFNDLQEIRLKIKCVGSYLIIYVNEAYLIRWQSNAFLSGQIGLYAEGGIEVVFKNFRIHPVINHKNP